MQTSTCELDERTLTQAIDEHGYAVTPPVLSAGRVDALIAELSVAVIVDEGRGGRRLKLTDGPAPDNPAASNSAPSNSALSHLARASVMHAAAAAVLGPGAFPVRALLFDKVPGANWKVTWHQDLTIAVRERGDVPGFGPWSEKDGVIHVQPPATLLARMIAIRLHLDDCHEANGPVRVIPGSHQSGRLTPADIADWRARQPEVVCAVALGGLLLMRPLLLHASSPSAVPSRRRVIHIEYAAEPLPAGLTWFEPS